MSGIQEARAKIPAARELILESFVQQGFDVSWSDDDAHLVVDGTNVPLRVQESSSHGDGWHAFYNGSIGVRVDWVWVNYNIIMKARTFRQAKSRPDTAGFDMAKIIDHVRLWLKTNREARAKYSLSKSAKSDWDTVTARLRDKYPGSSATIVASDKGVRIDTGHLDEKRAAAVLEALGTDEESPACGKWVCSQKRSEVGRLAVELGLIQESHASDERALQRRVAYLEELYRALPNEYREGTEFEDDEDLETPRWANPQEVTP